MTYAANTSVAFEKSVAEIITLVRKAGAEQIGQMEDVDYFTVGFRLADRMIRFRVDFPAIDAMPTRNGRGVALSPAQRQEKLAQAKRQRGRALLLVIKGKLESVESGIETVEQAFLANVVMADGQTVYERISAPIALEYREGPRATPIALLGGPVAGEGA